MLPDEASTKRTPGYSYLLAFLEEFFSGDDYSRSATRKALAEVCSRRRRCPSLSL